MDGFLINIAKATLQKDNFRKVLNTAQNSQLVVMSLLPGEEIGTEVHDLDQFIRIQSGRGKVILLESLNHITTGRRSQHQSCYKSF